ncbi:Lar family restriction alleviation protein [Escherichia coli]|nr:restriction alleviation protein, Lar family [Escherichia coli]EKG7113491.1 Lar family restriction alleviation protein [Escherichia coli]ELM8776586.1 Lar family restriction alleviation protein [Escherichia coli]EMA4402798.1 Lar family restriction alleviation protein [Escherichia coli]HAH8500945.1 restriction alleviation protein, Lar family [Escherichia coli]
MFTFAKKQITEEVEGLLPCPFCGGKATQTTIKNKDDPCFGGDVISCLNCGASSHVEFGFKENLISAWNARVTFDESCISCSEQIWISCSERMPADETTVLVADRHTGITWIADVDDGVFYPDEFPGPRLAGSEITHWKPLPAPPSPELPTQI